MPPGCWPRSRPGSAAPTPMMWIWSWPPWPGCGPPTPTWPAWRGTRLAGTAAAGCGGPRVESTWLARRSAGFDVVHHFGGRLPAQRSGPSLLAVHDIQPLDLPANFSTAKRRYLGWALPRSVRAADLVAGALAVGGRPVVGPAVGGARADPGGAVHLRRPGSPGRAPADGRAALRALSGRHLPPQESRPAHRGPRRGPGPPPRYAAGAHRGAGPGPRRGGRAGGPHSRRGPSGPRRRGPAWPRCSTRPARSPSRRTTRGSGLPVLEAMQCGTPVIAADATALPEVLGDGGDVGRTPRRGRLGRCAVRGPVGLGAHRTSRGARAWPGPPSSPPNGPRVGCSTPGGPRLAPPGAGDPMRLLVLCPHFEPDVAPTGVVMTAIVDELVRLGHEVRVVTSLPWYRRHRVEPGWRGRPVKRGRASGGAEVVRAHPFPTAKGSVAARAAGFAAFTALASAAAVVLTAPARRSAGHVAADHPRGGRLGRGPALAGRRSCSTCRTSSPDAARRDRRGPQPSPDRGSPPPGAVRLPPRRPRSLCCRRT